MKGIIVSKTFKSITELKVGQMVSHYNSETSEYSIGFINYIHLSEEHIDVSCIPESCKISELRTFQITFKDPYNETFEYCLDYSYWMYAVIKNLIDTNIEVPFTY